MQGIINLHKPAGKTSHDMVSFVRRTLKERRIGHAGTLDPDATGVLPILVGKATALSELLTEKQKSYVATVKLGVATDTYDMSGRVVETCSHIPTEAEIKEKAAEFLGEISQLPPMYSAIKMQGKKLYELARAGVTVERKARQVTIYSLCCFDFQGDSFKMEVTCSKGTYIRSLCHDLGKALGTCAAMDALVRTKSGPFLLENAMTPEELSAAADAGSLEDILLPTEFVLSDYPVAKVPEDAVPKIKNGLRMRPAQLGIKNPQVGDCFRLYEGEKLLCLSQVIVQEGTQVLSILKTFF